MADLSHNETIALKALCEVSGDWDYLSFKLICKRSGLNLVETRQAVRSLADRGCAAFSRGLWTEDGEPAGSGYRATDDGRSRYHAISVVSEENHA
jgi:hypothetical protein